MTEIAFHFNVPDKLGYACRLLRKAYRSSAELGVVGPAALLGELDRALWCFEPLEFLPHASARQAGSALAPHTRLWLASHAAEVPHHGVLVNLGEAVPEGFERFDRLIEVVSGSEADRLSGRRRWKQYADRGYAIQKFEVGA
ncbi:DNA polymerase III subunit chi [Aquabacterium sp. A7-Y]|uniref:DNA polymerase III subunit chi n=1 Tax=Aquabacterium sp. A7-Y TaxID=1349605 RepID=UPI00223DFD96|nr:DNA polymerase III subunit chi [Aquabacterium sp. A7-Y]MCW7537866.1 DNA polymerase III subunit chi [Aquabacterium sp. A7-Y]